MGETNVVKHSRKNQNNDLLVKCQIILWKGWACFLFSTLITIYEIYREIRSTRDTSYKEELG